MTARAPRIAVATVAALSIGLGFAGCGRGPAAPVNAGPDGVAIHGYDPVAYFTEGRPVRGRPEHELEWSGALWRFASARHRDLFGDDPEAFAPRYGGYCAYGVAENKLVDIDPEAWSIHDGALYLNVTLEIREVWSADVAGHLARSERNWPGLLGRR